MIKVQNDQCQEVLKNCRDSITILNKLVINQDTLINIKDEKIALFEKNQSLYDETLKNKDAIVESYKKMYQKQKRRTIFGYSIGGVGILLGLLVL
jgi:TATA-binding protein-associated factor Taf7